MKLNTKLFISVMCLFSILSCDTKNETITSSLFEINTTLATVTTGSASSITASSATIAGNVTADGGATVTARGVCYATTQIPTTANTCVSSGSGTGAFTANLTGLSVGTTYFVRAYATNSAGTSYSSLLSFTTSTTPPTVTTGTVSNITTTGATVTGNVTAGGGATVTARGICYATTQNPTTSGTCVASGSGLGSFSATLTGLAVSTTYFVRGYATNSAGTSYGSQISFTTFNSQVTDIDGNVYQTIQIGTQLWMAGNLKTTRYRNGTSIPNVTNATWSDLTTGAWVNYDNNPANDAIYGKLYNWYAATDSRNLCPSGWHVPSDAEWTVLSNFLGTDVGFKMKSTSGWSSSGNGSNASGFNGLPSGLRYLGGPFGGLGGITTFWSSTQISSDNAWSRLLSFDNRELVRYNDFKKVGWSVRCLRD